MGCPMTDDRGFPALLSQALVAYTIEFDDEFEHRMPHVTSFGGPAGPEPPVSASGEPMRRPWLVSQAMWSNFMRFVEKDGVPLAELDDHTANVAGLKRWGYIRVEPPLVRPTRAGSWAQAVWNRLDGVIDRRWQQRFGPDAVSGLRKSLQAVIGQATTKRTSTGPGGTAALTALPLYLPLVTYDNGMKTKYQIGSDRLPAVSARRHVPDVSSLDLSALLSQVLLLFTIDYERESALSLPIAANTMRVLDNAGSRLRDLPLLAAVSRVAVSVSVGYLRRHGYVEVGPDPRAGRDKVASLTALGREAREAHLRRRDLIEERWRDQFGAAEVSRLHDRLRHLFDQRDGGRPAMALGLRPDPEGWRARGPYLARSSAMVADPAASLPHHPMVLHRGGFPDGS